LTNARAKSDSANRDDPPDTHVLSGELMLTATKSLRPFQPDPCIFSPRANAIRGQS
jgi:hypothetical protein